MSIRTLENGMEVTVICPFCGEPNEIWIDPSGGSSQVYVEDCQTCCQAWEVSARLDDEGEAIVSVEMI